MKHNEMNISVGLPRLQFCKPGIHRPYHIQLRDLSVMRSHNQTGPLYDAPQKSSNFVIVRHRTTNVTANTGPAHLF